MRIQFRTSVASRNRLLEISKQSDPKSPRGFPFLTLIVLLVVSFVVFTPKPFVEIDPNGKPELAKWRKQKLERELKALDEAEQYVLVAKKSGVFPCYSCPNNKTIYLKTMETWKYGYTTKSEKGRYQNSLDSKNLLYFVQYEGTITACMKEEKRKIYYYALLPENLERAIPLIRPPGNKQDN